MTHQVLTTRFWILKCAHGTGTHCFAPLTIASPCSLLIKSCSISFYHQTSARNEPVYADIPYRNIFPQFHTETYQYILYAFISFPFFWQHNLVSLLRSTPAFLNFHFKHYTRPITRHENIKMCQSCSWDRIIITSCAIALYASSHLEF
jgi:hypothetical protein